MWPLNSVFRYSGWFGGCKRKAEIVHGEYVFEQFRFVEVANAAGLAGRYRAAWASGVGARIKIVVVLRFVDAHAPQNDGGMIPVAADHPPHVAHRQILPGFVADVLPAGDLFEDQQAEFVAGVQEVGRLRIVRGAHDVALSSNRARICASRRCTRAGMACRPTGNV